MSTALRTYFNGPNGPGGMTDHRNDQKRYFHYDYQGTVQCLTNETGAVTDRSASDAWGVQVKRTGTSVNRQWYIGRSGYYRQEGQELDYVRARLLDLHSGRWLSEDPIKVTTNEYTYALNAPGTWIDPSGLAACKCQAIQIESCIVKWPGVRNGQCWVTPRGGAADIFCWGDMGLIGLVKCPCCPEADLDVHYFQWKTGGRTMAGRSVAGRFSENKDPFDGSWPIGIAGKKRVKSCKDTGNDHVLWLVFASDSPRSRIPSIEKKNLPFRADFYFRSCLGCSEQDLHVCTHWGYYAGVDSLARNGIWQWRGGASNACSQLAALAPGGIDAGGFTWKW